MNRTERHPPLHAQIATAPGLLHRRPGPSWRTLTPVLLALILATGRADAASIIVNSTSDSAITGDGACVLREAITNANFDIDVSGGDCAAGAGADFIYLGYNASYIVSTPDPVDPDSGLPDITSNITLQGNNATISRDTSVACTLDGSGPRQFGLLTVRDGGNLTLTHLVLSHGCANGTKSRGKDGGAIWVKSAKLVLDHVTIRDSVAYAYSGALDTARSTVTIRDSQFLENFAYSGGAIGNGHDAFMTIQRSTIAGNSAFGAGGGIGNRGTLSIRNSTIANNSNISMDGGGGIGNSGAFELLSSTVVGNASTGTLGGGGIGNAHEAYIKNSIVANNGPGGDCVSLSDPGVILVGDGNNFDSDGSCAALSGTFVQQSSAQLDLGPLADNGGATQTIALGAYSTAIDAAIDCTDFDANPVPSDQRHFPRPQFAHCDIGAFELSDRIFANGFEGAP